MVGGRRYNTLGGAVHLRMPVFCKGLVIPIAAMFILLLQVQLHFYHTLLSSDVGSGEGKSFLLSSKVDGRLSSLLRQERKAEGTFNNVPIAYVSYPRSPSRELHSTAHCIGETFGVVEKPWVYRSCSYQNICFDTDEKELVLFRSQFQKSVDNILGSMGPSKELLMTVSSKLDTTVSAGSINVKWAPKDQDRMEWSPTVRDQEDLIAEGGYYVLPRGTILIPFHSFAAFNVGHLMWDDMLPIYSLLQSFGMLPSSGSRSNQQLMPIRYKLKHPLWATCDFTNVTQANCEQNFKKLLPLIGVDTRVFRSFNESMIYTSKGSKAKSRYVCSPQGAAGLGMLNDHGLKKHGYEREDYEYSQNVGKSQIFRGFRNYMMENIGMDPTKRASSKPPHTITVSLNSTVDEFRNVTFDKQIKAIEALAKEQKLLKREITLRTVIFKDYTIEEQIRMVTESAVLIGVCGGGAVTNMFLSDGAGMVLYYPDNITTLPYHKFPSRLDWDYFNNAGNARVHWLPISSMDDEDDLNLLKALVLSEVDTVIEYNRINQEF